MPSSTTTFIPNNADSSLVSEASSQNLPQGTGSEIKENGKVIVLKIEYLRILHNYLFGGNWPASLKFFDFFVLDRAESRRQSVRKKSEFQQ